MHVMYCEYAEKSNTNITLPLIPTRQDEKRLSLTKTAWYKGMHLEGRQLRYFSINIEMISAMYLHWVTSPLCWEAGTRNTKLPYMKYCSFNITSLMYLKLVIFLHPSSELDMGNDSPWSQAITHLAASIHPSVCLSICPWRFKHKSPYVAG